MIKELRATEICRMLLQKFLSEGSTVVDATAGNGYDTLFLAEKVGPDGKVYAFDIQQQALSETKRRLAERGYLGRVRLIHDSHEAMKEYLNEPLQALVYNLGYLPGGDKSVTTSWKSTIKSLKQGMELLNPHGVISIVAYPGHPGGDEEASRVEAFLKGFNAPAWHVFSWKNNNSAALAPYLMFIYKNG